MVTLVTLSILSTTTLLATALTAWTLYKGLPETIELQGPGRKFGKFKQRLPLIVFNLAILFLGPAVVLPFFEDTFTFGTLGWYELLAGPLIILLFDDTLFYFWHRFLHRNKWMYRKVHRLHHKAFAPLPLDYIYAHPVEWLIGAIGPILGVVFLHTVCGEISAWSLWIFAVLRQCHEINIHSGTKSIILNHVPGISPTDSHDLHHARPNDGNYSSIFEHWDFIFGTKFKKVAGKAVK